MTAATLSDASANSVFLNEVFEPYPNQWEFLESVQRIKADAPASLLHNLAPEGNALGVRLNLPEESNDEAPWFWRPSRVRKEGKIDGNLIHDEKKNLPSSMQDRLIRTEHSILPRWRSATLRGQGF